MTDYSGIFLRDALGDTNTLPRSDSDDTASPDIINSGTTPSANPQTDYGDSYDQSVGEDVVYGKRNYIYVRGKNYAANSVVGNASLYWCYAKQLDNPSTWQQLATGGGSNSSALAADSDGVAVTATPFVWAPDMPSSGNPYVLVAAVSDPDNPNPVPAYIKVGKPPFEKWQAEEGGVSALQLDVPAPPVVKSTYSFSGLLVLGNTAQEQLSITLLVSGGVVGDHFSCSFDATDVNGNPIGVGSTQITQPSMNIGTQPTVAAGLNARFTFEYAAQNVASPPHPALTLQVAKLVSTGGGGGGGDPFGPDSGNTEAVLVAQYVMTTALPS